MQQLLIYPPHLCTAATLPWGKLICCFGISSKGLSVHVRRLSSYCVKLCLFSAPDLQPSNSPDLNSVDYQIWGVMQDRVCRTPVQDMANLRQCLIDTWNGLSQSIVVGAIDEWCVRDFRPVWIKNEPVKHSG